MTSELDTNQMFSDTDGRHLKFKVKIDAESFLPMHFYNANTEIEQLKTLENLLSLILLLNINVRSQIVCVVNYNSFNNSQLEAGCGIPNFKRKYVDNFFEIKETLGLSGFMQRRLGYIFISNSLQKLVVRTDDSLVLMEISISK